MTTYTKPSPDDVSSFRRAIRAIAPPWLLGFVGERYLYTIGLFQDAFADTLGYSVLARFPQSGIAGILPHLGRDRKLDRGPNESDDAFALRIKQARRIWRNAGGPWALMSQVQAYFSPTLPTIRVVSNTQAPDQATSINVWYTLSPTGERTSGVTKMNTFGTDPTAWPVGWYWGDDDPLNLRWWRFWVIVGAEVPSFVDPMVESETVADLNRIIAKWTPPHCFMMNGIHLITDNSYFVPPFIEPVTTGDWTDPMNRDNVNAEYWDGPGR